VDESEADAGQTPDGEDESRDADEPVDVLI
jgi:hypothetical protein